MRNQSFPRPLTFLLLWMSLGAVLNAPAQSPGFVLFNFTNTWRYNQTTSYDAINWTAPGFVDSGLPAGRGVLGLEDANNAFVTSRTNTALTLGRTTYYFRTHFNFSTNSVNVSLTFSNIIDDGAVYYLNGVEIARFSMTNDTTAVSYATLAANHEASAVEVFTVSGPRVETNLINGDNVLAVEVHQTTAGSSDIVFGLALSATFNELTPPPLRFPLTPPVFGYTTVNAFPGLGFGSPVAMASPPGETNRLFIVNKAGLILVITNLANPSTNVFLDLSSRVFNSGESGLLGLAFHPGYATNRMFFVFYSVNATTTQGTGLHQRLSRFQTDAVNPNAAPTNSEQILITQLDTASNHNGGDVHFGPDGLLYVSLGDGGVQYDGSRHSQIISSNFFSAIMRLDVDSPFRPSSLMPNPHRAITNGPAINYRIPSDNPFIGFTNFDGRTINSSQVRTEFYAVGFRNPWRFSFDPVTGFLYCGDVGQDTWEEVDIITKGGNYGWAYFEGTHVGYRATNSSPVGPFILPIQEYQHGSATNQGNSVTGGVVYRGSRLAQLYGWYVFADYASGNIWILRYDGTNTIPFQRIAGRGGLSAFGTDPANDDVLMANVNDGGIYRLAYNTNSATGALLPPTLADTGAFTNLTSLTNQTQALGASSGMMPYDLNAPFWSDHARKSRWFLTATNLKTGFKPEGNWAFPSGLAWMKHFDLELTNGVASSARRLETRFIVKNSNGVYGVTYRWGNSLTNAALVPEEGLDESFVINDGGTTRTQVWHYPSRAECLSCHTAAGGFGLGFNTVQLHRDYGYPGGVSNQISFFSAAGVFSNAPATVNPLRALAAATNESASLEWRVRSYLAANCASCHQPGGTGLGFWNANVTTTTTLAGLINGALNNNGGDTNNRVIVPGDLTHSMMLKRISTRGPGQMPPLASTLVDTQAVALLTRWITSDLPAYRTFPQWQMEKFGSTNAPDALASADADLDGANNYQEYLAGTDPNNPVEAWGLAMQRNGPVVEISYPRVINRSAEVQWTTNLFNPLAWQFLDTPANQPFYSATNGPTLVPDAVSGVPSKFYRARLSEP